MKQPKRSHRTRYGEGTFKYNPTRDLWVGRYDTGLKTAKGTRRYITASARDENTAWQRFMAAKKDFFINGPKPDNIKPGQTVKGWAKEWLPVHKASVRPSGYMTDRGNVNNWILPQIGSIKLEDLTAAHMRKVGAAPRKEGRSPSTAHSAQRTLTKMLNAAKADGYTVPDRVLAAKKTALGKSSRTAMSKEEVRAVFAKAYGIYPDAVRLFLAVLYGARKSEVLGLTWDRVHIDQEALNRGEMIVGHLDISWQVQALPYDKNSPTGFHVKDGDEAIRIVDSWHFVQPKTGAGKRSLPLIAPVAKELQAWKETCPKGKLNPWNLVFPRIRGREEYLGYPRNKSADLAEWHKAQAAAKVYKVAPKTKDDPGEFYVLHEARHSMISMLADAKTPKHIIEMLVGQTELVDDYVHGSEDMAAAAVNDVLAPLLPAGKLSSPN